MPANLPAPSQEDVYVMPEKFHPQKAQRSSNKALAIVVIILLLIVVSSVSYFMYNTLQNNQDSTNQLANQNITFTNQNINTNENENRNINVNENSNTNENGNLNTNENINTNANTNTNGNTNSNINDLVPPALSGDADKDKLTDLEEALIGSSPSSPDSDLDGYLDSDEFIGGYNPIVSPSSGNPFLLAEAAFISKLSTNFPTNNFQTLYIKGWSVSLIEALHEARIITGTGEMIKISVISNDDQISAANWYLLNHPQITLGQLGNIEFGNFKGVRSPNNLGIYITDQKRDKIYAFEYDLDNMSEFRYPSVFEMIIRNFKLITEPIDTNTNTDVP
ncbi:MAG: hypothetical protein Q7K65_01185 [Candidatus Buchananbacteria bacterium]|nr:hypothetical protein [Candidatus Buchananbacteria bacterium]